MQGLSSPISPVNVLSHNHNAVWIRNIAEDSSTIVAVEVRTFDGEDFSIVPVETTLDFVDSKTVGPLDVVFNDDAPEKLITVRVQREKGDF